MAMRYGNITGWGRYVPQKIITNVEIEKMVDTTDEWIVSLSGIHERRVVSEVEQTSQMATEAAKEALEIANVDPQELDLIIVASSSPDYLTPPVSSQIQHSLGATGVGAFTIGASCAGFLYGVIKNRDLYECGRLGNFVASRCIKKAGAREGLPRHSDLKDVELKSTL